MTIPLNVDIQLQSNLLTMAEISKHLATSWAEYKVQFFNQLSGLDSANPGSHLRPEISDIVVSIMNLPGWHCKAACFPKLRIDLSQSKWRPMYQPQYFIVKYGIHPNKVDLQIFQFSQLWPFLDVVSLAFSHLCHHQRCLPWQLAYRWSFGELRLQGRRPVKIASTPSASSWIQLMFFFSSCFGFRVSSGVIMATPASLLIWETNGRSMAGGKSRWIFQPRFTVRANMELAQIYPFHGASQELFWVSSVVLRSYTQGMTLITPWMKQRSPKFWSSF